MFFRSFVDTRYNTTMISQYSHKNLRWFDLEAPNRQEILKLLDSCPVPPLVADELLRASFQSKAEVYKSLGLVYLVLHIPTYESTTNSFVDTELDVVVTRNFLITSHTEPFEPTTRFGKLFDMDSKLDKRGGNEHGGHLFAHLLREINEHTLQQLESIDLDIKHAKNHTEPVALSPVQSKINGFKKSIHLQQQVMESITEAAKEIFSVEYQHELTLASNTHRQIIEQLHFYEDEVDNLRTKQMQETQMKTLRKLSSIKTTLVTLFIIGLILAIAIQFLPY